MKSVLQLAFLGAVLWLQPSAQASPVLDISGGSGLLGAGVPFTFGWSFTVNSDIAVDGLGFWDEGSNGLAGSHQVGIWSNTGTLLTSATITNAGTVVPSASNIGQWVFSPIAPLHLAPGGYVIGATFGTNTDQGLMGASTLILVSPEITFGSGLFLMGAGLNMPTGAVGGGPGIFGPTFSTTSTPEPATFGLVGLALAGGMAIQRRRKLSR